MREAVGEGKSFNELGALLEEFSNMQVADSTCQLPRRLAADWAPSTSQARPAAFGVGRSALRATRPGAVLSFVYAKVIALALSRLLEFSMRQKTGEPG
ncbi:hypothetical protein HV824_33950 [Myxococcus sp. AM009]|uniref:hypothetical protein n=1 Tax=Myxococcus sp. AM009 TaxID=2745137 RepID=UPI00159590DC|nr:hypothetical protein [Myxococcus sp. AM009]NVJ03088.1 hypothetical protein [Myxococcus sp. AM009]